MVVEVQQSSQLRLKRFDYVVVVLFEDFPSLISQKSVIRKYNFLLILMLRESAQLS